MQQSLGLESYRRTLCLLPTHFGHGLICNCLFPWLSGQHLFVGPPYRPDLVMRLGTLLDKYGITFMSSVPSLWKLALKSSKPPESGTLKRVHRLMALFYTGRQRSAATTLSPQKAAIEGNDRNTIEPLGKMQHHIAAGQCAAGLDKAQMLCRDVGIAGKG